MISIRKRRESTLGVATFTSSILFPRMCSLARTLWHWKIIKIKHQQVRTYQVRNRFLCPMLKDMTIMIKSSISYYLSFIIQAVNYIAPLASSTDQLFTSLKLANSQLTKGLSQFG